MNRSEEEKLFIKRHGQHLGELVKILDDVGDATESIPFLLTSLYIVIGMYVKNGTLTKEKASLMVRKLCDVLIENVDEIK